MPQIFDNIESSLLPALVEQTLLVSQHADFCLGCSNLRGWKAMDGLIEKWPGGEGAECRLLVGMQRLPQDEPRLGYTLLPKEDQISQQAVIRLKRRLAKEFRAQLTFGAPTDEDEAGLRRLSAQLKAGKVVVKLFLRHTLHAKLYLCFRQDGNTGFLGSRNLTLAGLSNQGELNVDVTSGTDTCMKPAHSRQARAKLRRLSPRCLPVLPRSLPLSSSFICREPYGSIRPRTLLQPD